MKLALSDEFSNSSAASHTDITNSKLDCPTEVEGWGVFYALLSPVFLTGLVGNGLVIFVFVRHKHVRTAPNCLLMSLAVADFITLTLCATVPAYDYVGKNLPTICPVLRLVMETAMHGTGYSLLSLSVERYFAIARPLRSKAAATSFIRRALTFTWVGGLLLSFLKSHLQTSDKCQKCVRMIDPKHITPMFPIIGFLLGYVLTLVIIGVFYILMAHKLYFSGRCLQQNETITRQLEVRKRVALRVLLLVVMYAVSFFPYHFFTCKLYMFEDVSTTQEFAPLITIQYCIGCTHVSLNPFILYYLSNSFRTHFNKYLFRCFFKRSDPTDLSNSNRQKSDKRSNVQKPL